MSEALCLFLLYSFARVQSLRHNFPVYFRHYKTFIVSEIDIVCLCVTFLFYSSIHSYYLMGRLKLSLFYLDLPVGAAAGSVELVRYRGRSVMVVMVVMVVVCLGGCEPSS